MQTKLLHYERHNQQLLPRRQFIDRVFWHTFAGVFMLVVSLGIGILGYHFLENLSWVDSLLNASMILGGEGPVATMHTVAGKIFASVYSIFSGVIFLVVAGIMMAPMAHRILHKMHLADNA